MSADKIKSDIHDIDIPDEVIESLARTILPSIRKYFESEEGQKEYMDWIDKRKKGQVSGGS